MHKEREEKKQRFIRTYVRNKGNQGHCKGYGKRGRKEERKVSMRKNKEKENRSIKRARETLRRKTNND